MKPNLMFLIIDSFRADKFHGSNKTSQTPNIDSLIKNGMYFDQAVSASDATLMSWSSIFTSKFPFKTGIRSARFNKLDENVTTYFHILKKEGYHFYGLLPTLSETIGLFPSFENQDFLYDLNQRLDTGLGDNILTKLEASKKEPWFFLAHIMDLHFPIVVPKNFDDQKFGTSYYEKAVSALDVWVGKFFNKINLDDTLFLIISDHGSYIKSVNVDGTNINFEENIQTQALTSKLSKKIPKFAQPLKNKIFLSMEENTQKKRNEILSKFTLKPHQKRALLSGRADKDHFLFDENIRIPLLFLGPGVQQNQVIHDQVRSVDVFPTVCDLLGIKNPANIDGKSLLPIIDGKKEELPAYIESTPLVLTDSNDVVGIRTSKFKYFRDKNDPKNRIHLFDLQNDPNEDENIASAKPEMVDELESVLQNILKQENTIKETINDESQEIENELRKLGYV